MRTADKKIHIKKKRKENLDLIFATKKSVKTQEEINKNVKRLDK